MLILLPPSEGKSGPRRGNPLDLTTLAFPELRDARAEMLDALVELCRRDPSAAAAALDLGPAQLDLITRNSELRSAPTARADRVYSGVLYDALDLASVDAAARRRATRWLVIMSSLFGAVRPSDRIPAYRLSGVNKLPGTGVVSAHWRAHLDPVLAEVAGSGLVVDLRSSTYSTFWRPGPDVTPRTATVRVLHQVGDRRTVVSHFNKATKGRIVRAVLADGGAPTRPGAFADQLRDLGWTVEIGPLTRTGQQLDVVVEEI